MIFPRQTAVSTDNFDPNDVVVVGSEGVVQQGGGVVGDADVGSEGVVQQGGGAVDDADASNEYWNPANNLVVQLGILAAILLVIASYLVIGTIHVRWRAKRGYPPKWYHRFLLPNKYKDHFDEQENQFMTQPGGFDQSPYGSNDYRAPPPVYSRNRDSQYSLPEGASKVNPDQGHYYVPPPGALPAGDYYDDRAPGYPEATYAPGGRY